jgi:hypothetical protein
MDHATRGSGEHVSDLARRSPTQAKKDGAAGIRRRSQAGSAIIDELFSSRLLDDQILKHLPADLSEVHASCISTLEVFLAMLGLPDFISRNPQGLTVPDIDDLFQRWSWAMRSDGISSDLQFELMARPEVTDFIEGTPAAFGHEAALKWVCQRTRWIAAAGSPKAMVGRIASIRREAAEILPVLIPRLRREMKDACERREERDGHERLCDLIAQFTADRAASAAGDPGPPMVTRIVTWKEVATAIGVESPTTAAKQLRAAQISPAGKPVVLDVRLAPKHLRRQLSPLVSEACRVPTHQVATNGSRLTQSAKNSAEKVGRVA